MARVSAVWLRGPFIIVLTRVCHAQVLMLEAQQASRTDHAWVRVAMCKFATAACDQSKDFPGYVDADKVAARLCAPFRKLGFHAESRQLAMASCTPQPFRAPSVESVQRMLDMYGPKNEDHADMKV
jgi:hypothetical protein